MKARATILGNRVIDAPRYAALAMLAIYRAAISPMIHALFGPACRFEPTCSEYARRAIREHGVIRGGAMAASRIARCNPFGGHGFDPVASPPSEADLSGGTTAAEPIRAEGPNRSLIKSPESAAKRRRGLLKATRRSPKLNATQGIK